METMTQEQIQAMQAEIVRLTALTNKMGAQTSNGLSIRISPKGAVSVYGLGRFPLALYASQWLRLFTIVAKKQGQIKAFDISNIPLIDRLGLPIHQLPSLLHRWHSKDNHAPPTTHLV